MSNNNLMKHVYQYFLDLYRLNDSSSDKVFLSFEPIGRAIDLDSYKLNPTDISFFPKKALEEVSQLVDDIPVIDADIFRSTKKSVDEIYGSFILVGAAAGTIDQAEAELFNHLKSKAKQKFEDMTIGTYDKQGVLYRPTYANPKDWYDPSQTENWKSHSYQIDQKTSTSQGKPPQVKPNPTVRPWQWQVLPKEFTPVLTQPQILKSVSLSPALKNEAIQAEIKQKITNQQLTDARLNVENLPLNQIQQMKAINNFQATQPLVVPAAAREIQTERFISRAVLSEVAASQINFTNQTAATKQTISPAVLNELRQQIAKPQLKTEVVSSAMLASTTAVLLDKTYTKSVESNQLKLSFQYCIVHCDRPWLSHSLLQAKGWYIPGFEAGEFSTGNSEDNDGLFPALPIAFIVIKDLQISGWTSTEFEYVKDAMALGPFSLINREIKEGTLACQGMQIIGWISQLMPFIPPLSDPNPD